MTTLTITSLTPLLDRLFEQDEAARDVMRAAFADVTDADRIRMMQSKTDYRDLYHRLKDAPLAVSRETAHLLYMLARSSRAKTIVEFGTSFGVSTLHLAAGLRDNGGGRLITSEFEPSKAVRARENLRNGGLIDLVLLDGAKAIYSDILGLVEDRLKPGAVIIADNADFSPDYLARVRKPGNGYMSTPFAEDVELTVRIN